MEVITQLLYFLYICTQRNIGLNNNQFQTGRNFNMYKISPQAKIFLPHCQEYQFSGDVPISYNITTLEWRNLATTKVWKQLFFCISMLVLSVSQKSPNQATKWSDGKNTSKWNSAALSHPFSDESQVLQEQQAGYILHSTHDYYLHIT